MLMRVGKQNMVKTPSQVSFLGETWYYIIYIYIYICIYIYIYIYMSVPIIYHISIYSTIKIEKPLDDAHLICLQARPCSDALEGIPKNHGAMGYPYFRKPPNDIQWYSNLEIGSNMSSISIRFFARKGRPVRQAPDQLKPCAGWWKCHQLGFHSAWV